MEEQIQSSWDRLLGKIFSWVDTLIYNLPNMLIALLVFVVSYWLSGKIEKLVQGYLIRIIKQPSIRILLARIIATLLVLMGIILALYVLNLETTIQSLLAGAGLAGLAISFALQGTLANTLSGLLIATNNDINLGDWVEINGHFGEVVAIDLRNTKIRDIHHNILYFPNKLILDTVLINHNKEIATWINIPCGVNNDSNLEQVRSLVLSIGEEMGLGKDDSKMEFNFTHFAEEAILFTFRFQVNDIGYTEANRIKSEAIMRMKEMLTSHQIGIQLPLNN